MRKRKGIAVIAAIVMTAVMSVGSSIAATSVGMEDGAAAVTVDQAVVGFGGYEWWVIGDAKSGVYSKDKSVTLLSKNNDFGEVEFRKRSDTSQDGYKEYMGYWYEGSFENYPNEYKGSTLQQRMERIASNEISAKERGKINNRTLSSSDDKDFPIAGEDVANQKLWPLSADEYSPTGSEMVRSYGAENWLRSSSPNYNYDALFARADGSQGLYNYGVNDFMAVRPALNLNLESVIFTSEASAASKSSATPGGGLVLVTNPVTTGNGNKIKYTFRDDDNLKLGNVYVSKIENNTVTVKYEGATAGKTLSIIVKNNSGAVTHYGKLAENISAQGEAGFTLPDGYDSTKDKIELFAEEIGGENESDFANTPKALDMTIKNMVNVSGGSGNGLYAKDAEVTLIADVPAQGKRFVRWDISPGVTPIQGTSLTDETIKFTMPDTAVTATAVYEDIPPVVYPIKDGGSSTWRQGSEGGLIITSQGEHRKFTGVSVDGNMLDSQHYTAESGSTIVTLKASYLSTLSVGEHVLRIHFTDGYTETKFSIQEEQTDNPNPPVNPDEPTTPVNPPVEPGEQNPPVEQGGTTSATTVAPVGTSPKTRDSNRIWIMALLILGAGIGFMVVSVVKKSKKI